MSKVRPVYIRSVQESVLIRTSEEHMEALANWLLPLVNGKWSDWSDKTKHGDDWLPKLMDRPEYRLEYEKFFKEWIMGAGNKQCHKILRKERKRVREYDHTSCFSYPNCDEDIGGCGVYGSTANTVGHKG